MRTSMVPPARSYYLTAGDGGYGMSAVQDVMVWWAAQMLGLVPVHLRAGDAYGDVLIADVVPPGAGFSLVQRRNRQETPLDPEQAAAWLARRPPPRVVLRVPAAAVLERPLVLPLAVEPELDRAVAYDPDAQGWPRKRLRRRIFRRMRDFGAIREIRPDAFYLDEARLGEFRSHMRRRALGIVALGAAAVAAIAALA